MNAQAKRHCNRSAAAGDQLTHTEAAILALVAEGLSTRDVAVHLSISVGTVKCHLHHVFGKLDARNRLEAVVKARGRYAGSHA